MEHDLKCWPAPFHLMMDGLKPWEIRKNDRNYCAGDVLHLREWDPITKTYSGAWLRRRVIFVMDGGKFGLEDGCVCMTVAPL